MVKQTWIILAAIVVLPLAALAHPGPLDENGCHYCKVDCEMYGLKVGDYVCHIENDRTMNFTYKEVQTLRRHLARLTKPVLRQIARVLRTRDAMRNLINARDPECRMDADELGLYKAPLLARYRRLQGFGELLTAFACQNDLSTVPMVDVQGNIVGGLDLKLRRLPDDLVKTYLMRAGFTCANPTAALACSEWELSDEAIPATALKQLITIASQIERVSSNTYHPELTLEEHEIYRNSVIALSSMDYSRFQWNEFCIEDIAVCFPVHREWFEAPKDESIESMQFYHFTDRRNANLNVSPIQVIVQTIPDGVEVVDGEVLFSQGRSVGSRVIRDEWMLEISAPFILRDAVVYMTNNVVVGELPESPTEEVIEESTDEPTEEVPLGDGTQVEDMTEKPIFEETYIRFAAYVCFDGETVDNTESASCQTWTYWQEKAEEFCLNRCSEETGECGVEIFEEGDACTQEEVIVE